MHMGCECIALQWQLDQPRILNIGPIGNDTQTQALGYRLTYSLSTAHFKVDPYRNTVLTQDFLKHPPCRGALFAEHKILTLKIMECHGLPSTQTRQWMADRSKDHE